ncbi:CaiF/GrlA family transcriptional regulator [Serratia nevei]|uniref:CaiF/GrlA family transcriptional regulator n=1 Tax=Serratia nevei TaxID=2703794 RepID=UPI00313C7810
MQRDRHNRDPRPGVDAEGEWVQGQQGNHERYFRPACLANLPTMPLYLAVAYWGLLTGELLSVASLGQAFRIEQRRASEVLRYFVRYRVGVDFDQVSVRPCRLRIRHVSPGASDEARRERAHGGGNSARETPSSGVRETPPPRRGARPAGQGRGSVEQAQVRQWFLRRPNPSSEPSD